MEKYSWNCIFFPTKDLLHTCPTQLHLFKNMLAYKQWKKTRFMQNSILNSKISNPKDTNKTRSSSAAVRVSQRNRDTAV